MPPHPAILKDVFAEIDEEQQIKLRWLVVEGQAMNTDHNPQDTFSSSEFRIGLQMNAGLSYRMTCGTGSFREEAHAFKVECGHYRAASASVCLIVVE